MRYYIVEGILLYSLFLLVKTFKSFHYHLIFFCNAILNFTKLPFMGVHYFTYWSLNMVLGFQVFPSFSLLHILS